MSQFNGLLRKYIDLVSEQNLISERVVPGQPSLGQAPAPAAPAPAAPAADGGPAPTPEQLKWLGGADPTDKFILARMRKAVPNAAPAAAPVTAPAAAPAAAPAPALTAADQDDADMGAAMAANTAAAATQAANGVNAAGQNVTMPNGINPETGTPTTVTAGAPAAQQAARPRVPAKSDPAVLKIQQDLIAKGAKIKADGVMGPATQAAQKQFGQGAKPAPALPGRAVPGGGQISDTPMAESVYREDQALARIVQLARG
jgi:hypothetical protein